MSIDVDRSNADLAAEIERCIEELDDAFNVIPERAIRHLREHREAAIPRLIETIDAARRAWLADEAVLGNAHFFALFLLSELDAREALPVIIEALSLPGEGPFDLFGDAIDEIVPRILAAFCAEKQELIDGLIRNRDCNPYVRWGAMNVLVYFIRDGVLERSAAVERLRGHLAKAMQAGEDDIVSFLVATLEDLAAVEALEEIRQAFEARMVDEGLTNWARVQKSVRDPEQTLEKTLEQLETTGIPDLIDELRTWACFSEKPEPRPVPESRRMPPIGWEPLTLDSLENDVEAPSATGTIFSKERKVGRNEPCPCGSGKKYKKCCGAAR